MKNAQHVVVDWGTSSFRLWVLDKAGAVLAEMRSSTGMNALRPEEYCSLLESESGELGVPEALPVMICGMAGSAQGWVHVPYLDAPAQLATLAAHASRVPGSKRSVRIMPGIAQRMREAPDVMRGEETILLGAFTAHCVDGVVCLPGTHSKWALVLDGCLKGFTTAMTGEIYALLKERSILRHFLTGKEREVIGTRFDEAVQDALAAPHRVLSRIFSLRAEPLLFAETQDGLEQKLSGLLIGLEIAGMREAIGRHKVTLLSAGRLGAVYGRAFSLAGIDFDFINSEAMARVGLHNAALHAFGDLRESQS